MREAVAWAANGAGGLFNVNRAKIMVAGYSCGGTEAYEFINDSRISSIGISNSGYLSNYDAARTIKKPIVFMLGGSGDIAYGNVSHPFLLLECGKRRRQLVVVVVLGECY
jgi:dienelactone hydrolase